MLPPCQIWWSLGRKDGDGSCLPLPHSYSTALGKGPDRKQIAPDKGKGRAEQDRGWAPTWEDRCHFGYSDDVHLFLNELLHKTKARDGPTTGDDGLYPQLAPPILCLDRSPNLPCYSELGNWAVCIFFLFSCYLVKQISSSHISTRGTAQVDGYLAVNPNASCKQAWSLCTECSAPPRLWHLRYHPTQTLTLSKTSTLKWVRRNTDNFTATEVCKRQGRITTEQLEY